MSVSTRFAFLDSTEPPPGGSCGTVPDKSPSGGRRLEPPSLRRHSSHGGRRPASLSGLHRLLAGDVLDPHEGVSFLKTTLPLTQISRGPSSPHASSCRASTNGIVFVLNQNIPSHPATTHPGHCARRQERGLRPDRETAGLDMLGRASNCQEMTSAELHRNSTGMPWRSCCSRPIYTPLPW